MSIGYVLDLAVDVLPVHLLDPIVHQFWRPLIVSGTRIKTSQVYRHSMQVVMTPETPPSPKSPRPPRTRT